MAKGIKTGGRRAGTPNRSTGEVKQTLEVLGCDPIEGMAAIATDPSTGINLRFQERSPHYLNCEVAALKKICYLTLEAG